MLPPLNSLKAFEAAARRGSFVGAARELGVTPAAVSQQVKSLEHHLDRILFERRNNGLSLTDSGRALFPRVAEGFAHLNAAAQIAAAGRVRSRLVVSAPHSVLTKWLAPIVADYLRVEPEVSVDLRAEEDPISFTREAVDLRLCYGEHHYAGLAMEPLITDEVMPLCAPDLCAGEGLLGRPENVRRVDLIHTVWGPAFASHPTWSQWFEAAGLGHDRRSERGHRVTHSSMAIDLAASGAGVALGQKLLARGDLDQGRLVCPFGPSLRLGVSYCLVYPADKARTPLLDGFLAWLRRRLPEAGATTAKPA